MRTQRRYPFTAAFLQLAVPGAGYFYVKHYGRVCLVALQLFLVAAAISLFARTHAELLLVLLYWITSVCVCTLDSFVIASRMARGSVESFFLGALRSFIFGAIAMVVVSTFLLILMRNLNVIVPVRDNSMTPVLYPSDYVLVLRNSYHNKLPSTGSLVAFKRPDLLDTPRNETEHTYISRAIAGPDSTVEFTTEKVFVDLSNIDIPTAHYTFGDRRSPEVYRVPDGTIFVLSDNRDNSADSRDFKETFVQKGGILGKPVVVLYNPQYPRRVGTIIR